MIQRGSAAQDVRWLQEKLAFLGHDLKVDGIWGPRTEEAVKTLQLKAGLAADGIVGPKTKEAIEKALETIQKKQAATPAKA